ncbi:MAG: winged helix-turn-helix transcriptional regulator [Hyphomicrobiales bacterium]
MTISILLIENEDTDRPSGFDEALRSVGYAVRRVTWDNGLISALNDFPPDVIVIRGPAAASTLDHSLEFLTCFPAAGDAAIGLITGAVPNPHDPRLDFVLEETGTADFLRLLPALVRCLQNKNPLLLETALCWGDLTMSSERGEIRVGHRVVRLTRKAFALLDLLARRPGRVFSRRQIIAALWPGDEDVDERSVDVLVMRLRKALAGTHTARFISTVHNQGYMFRPRPRRPEYTAVPAAVSVSGHTAAAPLSIQQSTCSIAIPRSVPH